MPLAKHGKRFVAFMMYDRARSFLGSAALLHRSKGSEFVVAHLICQGVELLLKAALLLKDYDKFEPKLKSLGHNLEKLANRAHLAYGGRQLSKHASSELRNLNQMYMDHSLRYASWRHIFNGPEAISTDLVGRKALAICKLFEIEIRRDAL